jgi:hypothetical protein
MVNERRWLILIFSLYFILALGYSLLMPIQPITISRGVSPAKMNTPTWK